MKKRISPMIEISEFQLKPSTVLSVQVTEDNIHDVAIWCDGVVEESGRGEQHIRIVNGGSPELAFVDWWIIEDRAKIYHPVRDRIFKDVYEPVESKRGIFRLEHSDTVLQSVHDSSKCEGRSCSLHSRTNHLMRGNRQVWRGDLGVIERICDHGVGHPDPDDRPYLETVDNGLFLLHGCDGCCHDEDCDCDWCLI